MKLFPCLSVQSSYMIAVFHPKLPLIMVVTSHPEHRCPSIHVVSCPAVLYPFEDSDLTTTSLVWRTGDFTSRYIHTLEPRQDMQHISFRSCGSGSVTLDSLYILHESRTGVLYLSISGADVEAATLETACIELEYKPCVFECRTPAGRTVYFGIDESENTLASPGQGHSAPKNRGKIAAAWIRKKLAKSSNSISKSNVNHPENSPDCLFFLRFPDRSGEEPTWVHLELPKGVMLHGISRTSVLSFDDVYGTLLLDDEKGNYIIVQY